MGLTIFFKFIDTATNKWYLIINLESKFAIHSSQWNQRILLNQSSSKEAKIYEIICFDDYILNGTNFE